METVSVSETSYVFNEKKDNMQVEYSLEKYLNKFQAAEC
jgi:hypothetical protein